MLIANQVPDPAFRAGIVLARGVSARPSPPELERLIAELVARRAAEAFPPAATKDAIRGLLRRGGFKPTGRNKPASEYLAQAAREGRFPRINNLVDVNNLLSLETGLPISLLDLDAFAGRAALRRAGAGEKYVFNAAGQEIDLEGLVCVCQGGAQGAALGNPVKDSMAGKLGDRTGAVLGVIYASAECDAGRDLDAHAARLGLLLREFGSAGAVEAFSLSGGESRDLP